MSLTVLPTVLLVREGGSIKQVVRVFVSGRRPVENSSLRLRMQDNQLEFPLGAVRSGLNEFEVRIPEVKKPTEMSFDLMVDGEVLDIYATEWRPPRHWKVYVVLQSHIDIGYTDTQEAVANNHNTYLDTVVKLCDETRDWPESSCFKWNCEVSWPIFNYIKSRPTEQLSKLAKLIREGRIEVGGIYANVQTGICGHEELIRLAYYSNRRLREQLKIPASQSAMLDDVPGYAWGLVQVLAKAGIKYLAIAPNNIRAPFLRDNLTQRPFYWVGPDGSRVMVWYTDDAKFAYLEANAMGLTTDLDTVYRCLPEKLAHLESQGYELDAVHLRCQGAFVDNAPPSIIPCAIAREWNERFEYPKIIIATSSEFFKYMEENFSSKFPQIAADWPDWWLDGYSASARETGLNRISHDRALAAEKFAVIASLVDENYTYPHTTLRSMYEEMIMFDEHSFGSYYPHPENPSEQIQWKKKCEFAYKASQLSKRVVEEAIKRIAAKIQVEDLSVAVFNSLSWKRTDIVQIEISRQLLDTFGTNGFTIVDCQTKREVAYQLSEPKLHFTLEGVAKGPTESLILVFVAEDVPAMGYKTYRIIPSNAPASYSSRLKYRSHFRGKNMGYVMENSFYRVTLDPVTGHVISIYDKEVGVELVDRNKGEAFNLMIYQSAEGQSSPQLGWTSLGERGCVRESLHINEIFGAGSCPRVSEEIVLYDKLKRIDLINTLEKEPNLEKEGIYYAFPFHMENFRVVCEIPGGTISPGLEQIAGSSTAFYSVQHWTGIHNQRYGICFTALDSHLLEFDHISTYRENDEGTWERRTQPKHPSVYAYIMNNYWRTNFPLVQQGKLVFRFSLTSHLGDWKGGRAARFGWQASNPLIPIVLATGQKGELPSSFSYFSVDQPNVVILTVKMSEDRTGFVIRLFEMEGRATEATVDLPQFASWDAYKASILEDSVADVTVEGHRLKIQAGPYEFLTLEVKPRGLRYAFGGQELRNDASELGSNLS